MSFVEHIAGKAVLVTGASGFIGTHLCGQLETSGATLYGISRTQRHSPSSQVRWLQVDLTDAAAVCQVFRTCRPDIVFHLASTVVGSREIDVVLPTFHNNLSTTVHLLTAATEVRCQRIVIAGSMEEPDFTQPDAFARSPYAAAKWATTVYSRMFYKLFAAPVVVPRIFMTYGPGQKDITKLIPSTVLSFLRGQSPQLGSGQRLADWIYVGDVVEGLLRAAVVPGVEGCSFDLGTGRLASVREIVEQIAAIVHSNTPPTFGVRPDRPFEQQRAADTRILAARLGHWPQTPLTKGLEATVAWYRQELKVLLGSGARHSTQRTDAIPVIPAASPGTLNTTTPSKHSADSISGCSFPTSHSPVGAKRLR